MANPYHDETGKFCSTSEMKAAVERLIGKNDINGAYKLLDEFKEIEASQQKSNFDISLKAKKSTSTFPPAIDDIESIQEQARLYAKEDLWSTRFRNFEDIYVKGFADSYSNGETTNHYESINMYNLDDKQMELEAYKAGLARGSYAVRLQKEEVNFLTENKKYYGDEHYPFKDYHMLHNPISKGDTIIIPAGTPFSTTAKGGAGVTKRATKIKVRFSHPGYLDGSVGKAFAKVPTITAAGTGGYWKDFSVTPEVLKANSLPVMETLSTGMLEIRDRHTIN